VAGSAVKNEEYIVIPCSEPQEITRSAFVFIRTLADAVILICRQVYFIHYLTLLHTRLNGFTTL